MADALPYGRATAQAVYKYSVPTGLLKIKDEQS